MLKVTLLEDQSKGDLVTLQPSDNHNQTNYVIPITTSPELVYQKYYPQSVNPFNVDQADLLNQNIRSNQRLLSRYLNELDLDPQDEKLTHWSVINESTVNITPITTSNSDQTISDTIDPITIKRTIVEMIEVDPCYENSIKGGRIILIEETPIRFLISYYQSSEITNVLPLELNANQNSGGLIAKWTIPFNGIRINTIKLIKNPNCQQPLILYKYKYPWSSNHPAEPFIESKHSIKANQRGQEMIGAISLEGQLLWQTPIDSSSNGPVRFTELIFSKRPKNQESKDCSLKDIHWRLVVVNNQLMMKLYRIDTEGLVEAETLNLQQSLDIYHKLQRLSDTTILNGQNNVDKNSNLEVKQIIATTNPEVTPLIYLILYTSNQLGGTYWLLILKSGSPENYILQQLNNWTSVKLDLHGHDKIFYLSGYYGPRGNFYIERYRSPKSTHFKSLSSKNAEVPHSNNQGQLPNQNHFNNEYTLLEYREWSLPLVFSILPHSSNLLYQSTNDQYSLSTMNGQYSPSTMNGQYSPSAINGQYFPSTMFVCRNNQEEQVGIKVEYYKQWVYVYGLLPNGIRINLPTINPDTIDRSVESPGSLESSFGGKFFLIKINNRWPRLIGVIQQSGVAGSKVEVIFNRIEADIGNKANKGNKGNRGNKGTKKGLSSGQNCYINSEGSVTLTEDDNQYLGTAINRHSIFLS